MADRLELTADEIRARITDKRTELVRLIESIDAAELPRPGPDGGWAIKDHLVHIAAWEHWLVALLQGRDVLAAMGAGGAGRNIDDINAAVWERHRDDSVASALAYFNDAHEKLRSAVAQLSTEDFQRRYEVFFDQVEGEASRQPLVVAVAANTYDHYAEHIHWMKSRR